MEDAGNLRCQAEMFLKGAANISDRKAADALCAQAARYFAERLISKVPRERCPRPELLSGR
jgi:hypothetical protein